MKVLRGIVTELVGLFVDDWTFALGIVVWLALTAFVGPRLPQTLAAPVFFLGLAALTLVLVVRKARQ